VYFNVNFNAFFKSIKVHLLARKLYIHQNARCNNKNIFNRICMNILHEYHLEIYNLLDN